MDTEEAWKNSDECLCLCGVGVHCAQTVKTCDLKKKGRGKRDKDVRTRYHTHVSYDDELESVLIGRHGK